jgi:hypothetical protein
MLIKKLPCTQQRLTFVVIISNDLSKWEGLFKNIVKS